MTSNKKTNLENNKEVKKPRNEGNNNKVKKTHNEGKTIKNPTMMNRAVTGFSFLEILYNIGSLLFGLIIIAVGIYIRSHDDVPVTVVDAKVSSVTWEGNSGCESEVVTKNKGKKSVEWKCDVVATYNLSGSDTKEEYKFTNIGSRYIKNQNINLYRLNDGGTITHDDPNAWKSIGWIALGVGVFITFSSLFWLWLCKRSPELCAAKRATTMMGAAFQQSD
jgi:hypothetical protein